MRTWPLLLVAIGCGDITIPSGQASADTAGGAGADSVNASDSTPDEADTTTGSDDVDAPCQDESCLQSLITFSALGGAPISTADGSLTLGLTWSGSQESVPDGPTMTLGVLTGLLRTSATDQN